MGERQPDLAVPPVAVLPKADEPALIEEPRIELAMQAPRPDNAETKVGHDDETAKASSHRPTHGDR
ncbi:MAG: hypothetical protein ACYC53_13455 [Bacillota bacterium]